ncbi:hypothetical protein ACFYNO_38120 [Kitasatospora sp. NPDC006697]|uniref:hypothetical protein n=1 Tax=Kitasatospora sp. NPDC006697 TaxID=3364020 RepID=UPI0036B1B7F0
MSDTAHHERILSLQLVLSAYEASDLRSNAGKALQYAVRALTIPYAGHTDHNPHWLPRRGESLRDGADPRSLLADQTAWSR